MHWLRNSIEKDNEVLAPGAGKEVDEACPEASPTQNLSISLSSNTITASRDRIVPSDHCLNPSSCSEPLPSRCT